jgi:hypothetical protein
LILYSFCPKTTQLLSFRHSFSRNPPFLNNLKDEFPLKAYGNDVSGQTLFGCWTFKNLLKYMRNLLD